MKVKFKSSGHRQVFLDRGFAANKVFCDYFSSDDVFEIPWICKDVYIKDVTYKGKPLTELSARFNAIGSNILFNGSEFDCLELVYEKLTADSGTVEIQDPNTVEITHNIKIDGTFTNQEVKAIVEKLQGIIKCE